MGTTMKHAPALLCLLELVRHASTEPTVPASEFQLDGDFLIGGLFDVHHATHPVPHDRPEAIKCSR